MPTRRICLTLDLKDEPSAIQEYERLHRPGAVPPQVIADLKRRGYRELSIWRTAARLFMICEVDATASPAGPSAIGVSDPPTRAILEHWQAVTSALQKPLPGADPAPHWVEMRCVFDLKDHEACGL